MMPNPAEVKSHSMLRPPTLFSMLSWLPAVALGLMPDHSRPPQAYVSAIFVVMLLTMAWHFIDIRQWRAFSRAQAVVWCIWSAALLGFGMLMLNPPF